MDVNSVRPDEVRPSALAGTWYPGTKAELTKLIDEMIADVPDLGITGRPLALIVPHAGYVYSGQVAAYGYSLLRGSGIKRVVLIGPSHRAFFPGIITSSKKYFETPLGLVRVDQEAVRVIAAAVDTAYQAQDAEHSVEIQVPFLQRTLGDPSIVPLVLGDQSMPTCQALAGILSSQLSGPDTLVVASSDLSHFHHYREAVQLDGRIAEKIEQFDPEGIQQIVTNGAAEACGYGAITTALLLGKRLGAAAPRVLRYANSGDVTGDLSNVVGYLSAAIIRA